MFRFNPESISAEPEPQEYISPTEYEEKSEREMSPEAAEMMASYIEKCEHTNDILKLRDDIDAFLHRLEDQLGIDTLLKIQAYYILTADFEHIDPEMRFDLGEEYSLCQFLETLQ